MRHLHRSGRPSNNGSGIIDFKKQLLECFDTEDASRARNLIDGLPPETLSTDFRIHPATRTFIDGNKGHCYKRSHMRIADLLTPSAVRRFRDAVLGGDTRAVGKELADAPGIVNAEFTAGRGIARAIHHWDCLDVAKVLIDANADVDVLTSLGESPIAIQARFGSVHGLCFLLEIGADPNLGVAPHIPSERLDTVIELLLRFKWDIQGQNQLLHDAHHGHGKRVQTWLRYGVDPMSRNADRQTALHLLAAKGVGRTAIRALVESGADVNAVDGEGRTPLAVARRAARRVAAEELLKLGAG